MSGHTTVFIVDDDAAVCAALHLLLESAELQAHSFTTPDQCLAYLTPEHAGCLLLALRLPRMDGLKLHACLRRRGVLLPTIIITAHGNVPLAVRAIKAGVMDFIEKPFDHRMLLTRVRKAIDHDSRQRRRARHLQTLRGRFECLTARERQVMLRVVDGKANRQIAKDLGLSHKTIEVHRARMMTKTRARSLAELVRLALTAGVIPGKNDDHGGMTTERR